MYLEAKETALLYKHLTEKLGSDTTEAMFKYIDNQTERSVEANIKTLATKDDIASVKNDIANVRYDLRRDIGELKADMRKEIAEVSANNTKWSFIFWIGQLGAILGVIYLFLKK